MAVKGVFSSDQNIPSSKKGDFASGLLKVHPTGTSPLFALSAGMPSADAVDTLISWFEENHLSGVVNATNNAGTGTSITVDDASQVFAGGIYMNQANGEYIFVHAVSGNDLTVQRAFAGTAAVAIDGSVTPVPLQRITNAFEEGSSRPPGIKNLGYPVFNYQQIVRNAWDVTGTARVVEYHTGDVVAESRADGAMFHGEDIERAVIWGRKSVGTLNNKPFFTMDGIITQINDGGGITATQAGNTTWSDLDSFLRQIFERNIKGKPNERIAFCGNTVVQVINEIARLDGVVNLQVGQTDFGMEVMKWRTPYGNISLMTHPLMNENAVWQKALYVMHPGAIRVRYLRRTHEDAYDGDGKRAGVDADFGVFTTQLSVEYKARRTGGIYTGIDTAAASGA